MENETSAAPEIEANDPVFGGDGPVHMDACEEEPIDEQQVHIGLDKVTLTDDEDEAMHTNGKDEVIVIDEDTENDQDIDGEHISNGYTQGRLNTGRGPRAKKNFLLSKIYIEIMFKIFL